MDSCLHTVLRNLAKVPGLSLVPGISSYTPEAIESSYNTFFDEDDQYTHQLLRDIKRLRRTNKALWESLQDMLTRWGPQWRNTTARAEINSTMREWKRNEKHIGALTYTWERRLKERHLRQAGQHEMTQAELWAREDRIRKMQGKEMDKKLQKYRDATKKREGELQDRLEKDAESTLQATTERVLHEARMSEKEQIIQAAEDEVKEAGGSQDMMSELEAMLFASIGVPLVIGDEEDEDHGGDVLVPVTEPPMMMALSLD